MERRIDRSCLPRDVLKAIDTIYEYLPSSLLTEIRISKQEGSFCIPTSGTSPSPPPDDIRAQRDVVRKIALLATKRRAASLKNSRKSPEEIGQALKAALRIKVVPETAQKPRTYEELYLDASNARNNEAIDSWHMVGKKLRCEEDPKVSLKARVIS